MQTIGLIAGKSGDSLTDELHKRGYKVAIVCGRLEEAGYDSADERILLDLLEFEKIIRFFQKKNVKKIIIGTGHYLVFNLVEKLEQAGFKTNIDIRKSLLAKDKVRFKKKLEEIGVDTPAYASFLTREEFYKDGIVFPLPCVVKSNTDTVQSKKINDIENLAEAAEDVFSTNAVLLLEQYIQGNDCTVAVVNDGITVKSLGVLYYSKAKEYGLKGFDLAKSEIMSEEKEKEVCKIASDIVRKIGFSGLVRIDFIISEKIYVLELNSVIVTGYHGSAYPFFEKQGINIATEAINASLKILKEE